ncbi:MAG TPA: sulfotransferase [Candidatus Acidoferrum sp.]|nr:sulfotransferase [Candidatus Acidoferrum sp.]
MKLKRQTLVSQGSLSRMLQAAMESWQRRDFQQSIEILERASRLDPANSRVLLDLGGFYGKRYDPAAAERCFEKAVRVAPRKAEALVTAGQQSRDFGNYAMAERYFQRASEQKDATPETLVKLAELYERLRRVDDAALLIDRALRANGACAQALLARARLERQAGRLKTAEELIRSLLTTADRESRVHGWYELGGILDRQQRYDEAMSAFLEAKALVRPDAPPFLAQRHEVRARLKEFRSGLTREKLQAWLDCGQALQPSRRLTLLGGHPRSGTTLLEQVLDSHPDVISAEETPIFHDDAYVPIVRHFPEGTPLMTILESVPTDALQQSRQNYFRCAELFLGNPIAGRLLLDKNPYLTDLIPVLVRVFPESRLLVALRDPRDVVLSCFMQCFFPLGTTNAMYLSLEDTAGEYAELMSMWTTVAPLLENSGIEVRYEDMVENLESVARRTLDFLGVAWDERVLRFDEHARQKLVRSPTYADVTQPVYKRARGRWRNYQKYLEPHLEKLEPFVKAFGYA